MQTRSTTTCRTIGENRMSALATLITVVGVAGTSGGCQGVLPTSTEPAVLAVTEVQNPCTRISFRVFPNGDVAGTMPPAPCTGSPIAIQPGTPPTWSYKTSPKQILKIRLRLRNQEAIPISWPRLTLSPSGRTVIAPAGTSPAKLVPIEADSVRSDGTAVWRLMPASGGAPPLSLAPNTTTASRDLYFRILPPATEGAFDFTVLLEDSQDTTGFPAVAPDSAPAWFQHDSSYTPGGALKRVLSVAFFPVSVAERKAAIDSVGGIVIGGQRDKPGDMGYYFIFIPGADTDPRLDSVGTVLNRQPAVQQAEPLLRVQTSWRRPNDGFAWKVADWALDPLGANGENWALEAIAAPHAWGCSIGASTTKVAVVDISFLPDNYSWNTTRPLQIGRVTGDTATVPHGSVVSNLLAARGDDSTGMTGVMWRADLLPAELPAIALNSHVRAAVIRSAMDGASVINISLEAPVSTSPAYALGFRAALRQALDTVQALQLPLPLVVVAAGNLYRDPTMAGFPWAKVDYPRNVLVVGGAGQPTATGANLMPGTGTGPLVGVYGPATDVHFRSDLVTDPTQILKKSGTSFAAPLVSGVAGLLKSFDPSLSAEAIHDLIVQGADSGRIAIQGDAGKFMVNAYESLKLAARRPGAPLCGNRVWSEFNGGQSVVRVERNGIDETIYTAPANDTLSVVFPAHGGRTIYTEAFVNQNPVRRELAWSAAGWGATNLPGYDDSNWSGTSWSLFGFTHDADSVVYPRRAGFGGLGGPAAMSFSISLGTNFSFGRTLGLFTAPSMPAPNLASGKRTAVTDSLGRFVSYTESQQPGDRIIASSFNAASVRTNPSPMHDRVFVVVNYHSYQHSQLTGWSPCPGATPIGTEWSCQHRQGQGSVGSTRTEVWSTAWTGGPPQLLWTRPNQTISWLGLAEQSILGRQEAVIGIGHSNDLPFGGAPGTFTSCAVEYVNILTGATLRAPRPANPRLTCQFGASELGTMAPAPALIGPSGH